MNSRSNSYSDIGLKSAEATERSDVELIGREFRIVEKGLDPDEVVAFLQTTAGSSDDVFQRLEQFSALRVAARTMEESITQARRLAEYAKTQAETEAQQTKTQATEEAERQATVIIDQAKESCAGFVNSTHTTLLEVIKEALEQARETLSQNLTQIHNDIEKAAQSHLAQWEEDVGQFDKRAAGPTIEAIDITPDDEVTKEKELEEVVPDLVGLYGSPAVDSETGESPGLKKDAENRESGNTEALGLMNGKLVEATDGLYQGSVRIIIPRGVKTTWMQQFQDRISQVPGVRIQGESERDKDRIEVTLSLEKPVEILPLLQELPNVRKIMEAWNAGESPEERGSGQSHQVIKDSGEVALILHFA